MRSCLLFLAVLVFLLPGPGLGASDRYGHVFDAVEGLGHRAVRTDPPIIEGVANPTIARGVLPTCMAEDDEKPSPPVPDDDGDPMAPTIKSVRLGDVARFLGTVLDKGGVSSPQEFMRRMDDGIKAEFASGQAKMRELAGERRRLEAALRDEVAALGNLLGMQFRTVYGARNSFEEELQQLPSVSEHLENLVRARRQVEERRDTIIDGIAETDKRLNKLGPAIVNEPSSVTRERSTLVGRKVDAEKELESVIEEIDLLLEERNRVYNATRGEAGFASARAALPEGGRAELDRWRAKNRASLAVLWKAQAVEDQLDDAIGENHFFPMEVGETLSRKLFYRQLMNEIVSGRSNVRPVLVYRKEDGTLFSSGFYEFSGEEVRLPPVVTLELDITPELLRRPERLEPIIARHVGTNRATFRPFLNCQHSLLPANASLERTAQEISLALVPSAGKVIRGR